MSKTKEDKGIKSEKKIENSKKNLKIILISIATIVLLVIIGISIYFFLKNDMPHPPSRQLDALLA